MSSLMGKAGRSPLPLSDHFSKYRFSRPAKAFPGQASYYGVPFLLLMVIGVLEYNGNGHHFNLFNGIVLFIAFVLFFTGCFIVRLLNKKFKWTEKLAEKERKHYGY